eukprot:1345542-Amphidinium_carterae.1
MLDLVRILYVVEGPIDHDAIVCGHTTERATSTMMAPSYHFRVMHDDDAQYMFVNPYDVLARDVT